MEDLHIRLNNFVKEYGELVNIEGEVDMGNIIKQPAQGCKTESDYKKSPKIFFIMEDFLGSYWDIGSRINKEIMQKYNDEDIDTLKIVVKIYGVNYVVNSNYKHEDLLNEGYMVIYEDVQKFIKYIAKDQAKLNKVSLSKVLEQYIKVDVLIATA